MRITVIIQTSLGAVEAECEVSGEYRRATWGFDGGSPEEFPEVEILEAHALDDIAEHLSDADRAKIEAAATESAMEDGDDE